MLSGPTDQSPLDWALLERSPRRAVCLDTVLTNRPTDTRAHRSTGVSDQSFGIHVSRMANVPGSGACRSDKVSTDEIQCNMLRVPLGSQVCDHGDVN